MFSTDDYFLLFKDEEIVTIDSQCFVPSRLVEWVDIDAAKMHSFLMNFGTKKIFAACLNLSHLKLLDHFTLVNTRKFLITSKPDLVNLILRGKQLVNWHLSSLYCGSCGGVTQLSSVEVAKICSVCQKIIYPTTSPAVIVSISHGDQILLARSSHFPPGMYSILAGFVEAGESCEDTIKREIHEEVNFTVKNITYFGSQSWPFPNSFMIGFHTEYDSGELILNEKEIEDAKWFSKNNLPLIPPNLSIARQMIDSLIITKK